MMNLNFFMGLIFGVLILAVPLSYYIGKHETAIEKEQYRVTALHCIDIAQQQDKVFKQIKFNLAKER